MLINSLVTTFSVTNKLINQILPPYTECSTVALSIHEHIANVSMAGFLFINFFI